MCRLWDQRELNLRCVCLCKDLDGHPVQARMSLLAAWAVVCFCFCSMYALVQTLYSCFVAKLQVMLAGALRRAGLPRWLPAAWKLQPLSTTTGWVAAPLYLGMVRQAGEPASARAHDLVCDCRPAGLDWMRGSQMWDLGRMRFFLSKELKPEASIGRVESSHRRCAAHVVTQLPMSMLLPCNTRDSV